MKYHILHIIFIIASNLCWFSVADLTIENAKTRGLLVRRRKHANKNVDQPTLQQPHQTSHYKKDSPNSKSPVQRKRTRKKKVDKNNQHDKYETNAPQQGSLSSVHNYKPEKKGKDEDQKPTKKNASGEKKNQQGKKKPGKKNQGKNEPAAKQASALGHDYDSRIIGGTEAQANKYDYMVSLQDYNGHFCGGSLITRNVVLTAAHCRGGRYTAVLGRHDLGDDDGQENYMKKDVPHPYYSRWTTDNDFMLVFLEDEAILDDKVGLLSLNSNSNIPAKGGGVTAMGWGDTDISDDVATLSDVLMEVNVNVMENKDCDDSSGNIGGWSEDYNDQITENMICARADLRDSCQGDSGGPLVLTTGPKDVQVGLVSWGIGCASEQFPGVYSRVSSAYDWIEKEICKGSAYAEEDGGFNCSNSNFDDNELVPTPSPGEGGGPSYYQDDDNTDDDNNADSPNPAPSPSGGLPWYWTWDDDDDSTTSSSVSDDISGGDDDDDFWGDDDDDDNDDDDNDDGDDDVDDANDDDDDDDDGGDDDADDDDGDDDVDDDDVDDEDDDDADDDDDDDNDYDDDFLGDDDNDGDDDKGFSFFSINTPNPAPAPSPGGGYFTWFLNWLGLGR